MKYSDNAINIITTKSFKGIGRPWINKNLKGSESIETIVALINKNSKQSDQITINDFQKSKTKIINQLERLEGFCDGNAAIGDKNFPRHRGNVKKIEQPIFLFYKGNLDLLDIDNPNITVIGLLNPDDAIVRREQRIVAEIVKYGITIVSGLALGCESIAHKQALNGGKTNAILLTPLNNILPAKNRSFAFEIVEEGGLLVTEYFDEHKSSMDLNSRYKERDRLQALYCDAIILISSYAQDSAQRWKLFEQKLDSGARLAMDFAREYNILRAVMYDQTLDSNNPMFDLNRQLISEQRDITILTQKSLEELIKKIMSKKNTKPAIQTKLFE